MNLEKKIEQTKFDLFTSKMRINMQYFTNKMADHLLINEREKVKEKLRRLQIKNSRIKKINKLWDTQDKG